MILKSFPHLKSFLLMMSSLLKNYLQMSFHPMNFHQKNFLQMSYPQMSFLLMNFLPLNPLKSSLLKNFLQTSFLLMNFHQKNFLPSCLQMSLPMSFLPNCFLLPCCLLMYFPLMQTLHLTWCQLLLSQRRLRCKELSALNTKLHTTGLSRKKPITCQALHLRSRCGRSGFRSHSSPGQLKMYSSTPRGCRKPSVRTQCCRLLPWRGWK